MAIAYTNQKGFTYYLCRSATKTGKARYTFVREPKGESVDTIPDGFRISESVNGIVSEEALQQRNLPDWMHKALQKAHQVEQGYGTRFLSIPATESRESYRDMERFIDTVQNAWLHSTLQIAIQGRGAFRRFKDILLAHPVDRERWFAFSSARTRERVLEWLKAEGIVAINEEK